MSVSPERRLVIVCIAFTLILLYFSPIISFNQGQTPPASIQTASPVVFVCLHFLIRSGKAASRTRLQSESSCCCLRRYTTAGCSCQDIYRSYTHSLCGTHTYTCSHPRITTTNMQHFDCVLSSLCLLCCRTFFSVVQGLVVNFKICCSMKMLIEGENSFFSTMSTSASCGQQAPEKCTPLRLPGLMHAYMKGVIKP